MDIIYKQKYLKYKQKYLSLKNMNAGSFGPNLANYPCNTCININSYNTCLNDDRKFTSCKNYHTPKNIYVWLPFPKKPDNIGDVNHTSAIIGSKLIIGSPFFIPKETLGKNNNINDFFNETFKYGKDIPILLLSAYNPYELYNIEDRNKVIINNDLIKEWNKPNKYHFVFLDSPESWEIEGHSHESEDLYNMKFKKGINYIFTFGHELCGFNVYSDESLECNPKKLNPAFLNWFKETFPNSTFSFVSIYQSHSGTGNRKGKGITVNYGVAAAIEMTIGVAIKSGIFDTSFKY